MTLKHLLLSALMLLSAGSAWADVEINETNFPDEKFRKYLLSQSYGKDGFLTDVEIAGVNEIYIFNSSIQTLQGIEYFTALTRLECFSNQLTSLDVSGCTALEELICNDNQLTSLDVSKNTKLRGLYCENNQLTSLDVSKNAALKYLICSSNPITSLDVSKNTALIKLSCSNTMLTVLNCNDNQLAELYVLNNAVLTELQCNGNQLTSLDVSGCTALTLLSCYGNKLKSIDISECTVLTELYCGSNKLTSLDVSKNTALTVLSCYSNKLTSLDLSKNTKLKTLYCYQSQINGNAMDALVKSLPTGNNSTMRVITIGNDKNVMTTTQVAAAKAKGWTPYYTTNGEEWTEYAGIAPAAIIISEENFPDENFRIWLTDQEYGKDAVLTDEEITGISEMYVDNRGIKSLQGIEYFTELTRLWCYGNKLTSLDVSKNTKLTDLSCSNNQLTSLDMSKNKALTNLDCHYNLLTSLDLSKNTAITVLSCYGNQLTSLDVSKNAALTTLYCYSNQLTSLDVSKNIALTWLECYENQLTSLDVSKNTALKTLYCYQNQIKGAAMDALVESLPLIVNGMHDPVISNCVMRVIYYMNEQNEMTTSQIASVKSKGWTSYYYNINIYEWKPLMPPMPNLTQEELIKLDMSSIDMYGWFVEKNLIIANIRVAITKNLDETEYNSGSIQTADGKLHPYSCFYVPSASTTSPNIGFYLPYNLTGEYDIFLVTMPLWTYQNNFNEEKHRYRFRARITEKNEQNIFPSLGTFLKVDGKDTFETPEVDKNTITNTTFIGTYNFNHSYTDNSTPGAILQINPVLSGQNNTYSNSMIFAGIVLVAKNKESQTGIVINNTNFPDGNFRSWLLSQSYGSDGVLTDEEIEEVTSIIVSNKSIQSLKGIEYFTALTKLACPSNQLTSLDVSKNTKLIILTCRENQLTSLDVSKNTKLTELECGDNQLTSLDVSKNIALTYLFCSDNFFTSLDVSKNTALTMLLCYNNQLTSLDVTKNTALTELYCSSNQLTSLDLSKNTALTYLSCYQNRIKGAAMDVLVESLPTIVSGGGMPVVYYENEQNTMTTTQVAAAKAKGWTPRYTTDGYDWKEYAGIVPSAVTEVKTDASDSAPWYTNNGTQLTGKPTISGIYIHNGKKVVVK